MQRSCIRNQRMLFSIQDENKSMNLQEQECADKLASHGDKVVADIVGHSLEDGRNFWGRHLFCVIGYAGFRSFSKKSWKKSRLCVYIFHDGRQVS